MVGNEPSLEILIAQARVDGSALGKLFERYRPFLVAVTRHRIGARLAVRVDASDIVQDTMAEAFQGFPSFRGCSELEFSLWLTRIHERNLIEAARKHAGAAKRSIDRERPMNDQNGSACLSWLEPAADQTTPSQHLIRGERALRLAAALESLPELQREAVRLRHLDGWHVEQIAKELDRSITATAGLIKRGLQALRTKMAEDSWDSLEQESL